MPVVYVACAVVHVAWQANPEWTEDVLQSNLQSKKVSPYGAELLEIHVVQTGKCNHAK